VVGVHFAGHFEAVVRTRNACGERVARRPFDEPKVTERGLLQLAAAEAVLDRADLRAVRRVVRRGLPLERRIGFDGGLIETPCAF